MAIAHFSSELFWLILFVSIFTRYFILAGAAFLVFYVLRKNKWAVAKIQNRFPGNADYRREVLYSLCSVAIFASTAWLLLKSPIAPYTHIYRDFSAYGTGYFIGSIFFMMVLHDTYFYWTHRLLHHPKLFKISHLIHHKSHNPSPWAAYAFHPVEGVVEAGILWVIAFSIPVHVGALSLFFFFSIAFNVLGHLGYEIFPKGMDKHWLGQWINTSTNHNMHHKYGRHNYGLYFTFWDKMMGTTHPRYHETFEEVTRRRSASAPRMAPSKN
ncbi:MAG: sterol desaturase family protein [Bacteroidetes bacterium]|nr:MAG: sterol desaturase family protein [Bacteroidota bacterium]